MKTSARRAVGWAAMVLLIGPVSGRSQTPPDQEKKAGPRAGSLPFSYNPGGRRDPFRDLFGGKEIAEKKPVGELVDLAVEEVVLMGIVKIRGRYEAIISLTQGFPMTIHEGDSFADGYVLSIEESRVVLRKTKDRGIPLGKPKDIVKEITQQER